MKYILLLLAASGILVGCGANIDKWSWLPRSTNHDAEIAQISKGAEIDFSMGEPLGSNVDSGFSVSDLSHTAFMPASKDSSNNFVRGSLISKLGSVKKEAKWGDWDFVYADAAHTEKAGWGYSLTSGQILLPRKVFLDPPADRFVQNSFEIESFGDDYVLIRLDPAKGHRLCFMMKGDYLDVQTPTAGFIGSKAEVNGMVLERKANGWYSGNTRLSE